MIIPTNKRGIMNRDRGGSYWQMVPEPQQSGFSLSGFLSEVCAMDEAEVRDLIDFGSVHVNGKMERDSSRPMSPDDVVRIYWPRHGTRRFYEIDPDRILFQDRWILAYNKEAGIPSQQVPSDAYNNVFSAMRRFVSRDSQKARVYLHHRLDQDTTGVILFGLDPAVNRPLARMFSRHGVVKIYLAWLRGRPNKDSWECGMAIGRVRGRYRTCPEREGKPARTVFRVLHRHGEMTLVEAVPITGRTHQIRLHALQCGCPIVGDARYGGEREDQSHIRGTRTTLLLHAFRLVFPHPITEQRLVLTAPVPRHWPKFPEEAIPDAARIEGSRFLPNDVPPWM